MRRRPELRRGRHAAFHAFFGHRENVAYWIDEYHLDGYRFDATQTLVDSSTPHILAEAVTGGGARRRGEQVDLPHRRENEPQDSRLCAPANRRWRGSRRALWNDDFHHAAFVALTGHREAYFMDYAGQRARACAACVCATASSFRDNTIVGRGRPAGRSTRGLPPHAFVAFLENSRSAPRTTASAKRLWSRVAPGFRLRALTALLLLAPWTPLLFQGQEWNAERGLRLLRRDHETKHAALVKAGRAEFLQQFPRYGGADARDRFSDPAAPATFESSRLDWKRTRSTGSPTRLYAASRICCGCAARIRRCDVEGTGRA